MSLDQLRPPPTLTRPLMGREQRRLRPETEGRDGIGSHLLGCLCIAFGLLSGHADAQQYPRRPVTLVVPFPPGAATDAFARVVARRMSDVLGQQIVVINRDGASGIIGTDSVVRAA